jgi:hypothetical protein
MMLSIPSLMWLLPIVFMVHDLEEVVMMQPWYRKNGQFLKVRFPRLMPAISRTGTMSTPAFALAAGEEFVALSAITLVCVEYGLYDVWAGFLLGFFIHLVYHVGSFFVIRRYVPYIITSVLAGIYSALALIVLNDGGYLAWDRAAVWTAVAIVLIIVNFVLAVGMAERFDKWLTGWTQKT